MNQASVQYDLASLIVRAGGALRGRNRAACWRCGGRRTVSYNQQVFYCHKCGLKGNGLALARRLGLPTGRITAEYRAFRRRLERLSRDPEELAQASLARRWQLQEAFRSLLTIKQGALKRLHHNSENELAWAGLACFYRQMPVVLAELMILEDGHARDVKTLASGSREQKEKLIDRVLSSGGIALSNGKFLVLEFDL